MEMNTLFESVYSKLETGEFDTTEILSEGATWQTIKTVLNEDTASIKKSYKNAKAAFKAGEYDKAIKHITAAKSGYEKLKKKLHDIDDTIGGNIVGWIFGSGLLTLVLNVKAGGIRGFGHFGVQQIGHSVVIKISKAQMKNVSTNFISDLATLGGGSFENAPEKFIAYYKKLGSVAGLTVIASEAIKMIKFLSNIHGMKKRGEKPTWNMVKSDVIATLQSNIKACDHIIERCKAAKKNAVSESFVIFIGDDEE